MFEEMLEIADDGANDTYLDKDGNEKVNVDIVQRSRLRVDARKWALARMSPRRYGDRVATEISGPNGGPIQVEDPGRAIDEKLAALAQKMKKSD